MTRENEEVEGADAVEDMQLAFELLGKYKKDKSFIQKDVENTKKAGKDLIQI